MKIFLRFWILLLSIVQLTGCGLSGSGVRSDAKSGDLSNRQAIANAKALNEANALGGMDGVFNLVYTGEFVESDGDNRDIVRLDYQYEKSNHDMRKTSRLYFLFL